SLDTTFDTDGKVTTVLGTQSIAQAMAIQSDGKIVVAGYANNGPSAQNHFNLVRYNTVGSLDTTFDTDGKVTTVLGTNSFAFDVAVQPDGKIVVAGYANNGPSAQFHFNLTRFQSGTTPILLRATLSGSEEVPAVTTLATGSATLVISPGQTEISYTLHIADIGITGITAVQLHFGAPGAEGRALFTLTSSPFVSPLTGKLTAADLERIAATEGINTFADAIKAMRDGNTYLHIHTATHLGGEIRGQILEAPPTLSQLQAEIFTPRCAHCHISGQPGGNETGLFLNSLENSFNLLVNVPSTGDPNVKRVEPDNPDASYLIHKLEGTVSGQMPADGPPFLSDEQIKKVRDWISGGAKND
ncbi:MAG: CHRD domain-containing protein, partial [Candidatus Manganitrophus sp. SA1]|nr:CHRD domain-containing protein [Candidatus Manganitrophus morganii]